MYKQALDGVGNVRGRAAISHRSGYRSDVANASAYAEVIRIHHFSADFDFLALDADIRNPMLAATVRASGDVQFNLFENPRQPFVEFGGEPARETLGFRQCQLAEFRSRARD